MIYVEKNKLNIDSFIVRDKHNNPITGLISGDFTIKLYNPNKNNVANISAGVVVTIEEVGDGFYRVLFISDILGAWNLIIINSTYIPEGVGENYYCVESLRGVSFEIEDMIKRTLGLSQENYRIFDPVYDKWSNMTSATIKIYPTAIDVDNNTNAIAEYEVVATYNKNKMITYKVKKQ